MTVTSLLDQLLAKRILVLDGAMGTMIQRYGLTEADYRGERFGDEYKTYCENVRRWIPRLTPWYPPPTWTDLRGRLQPG